MKFKKLIIPIALVSVGILLWLSYRIYVIVLEPNTKFETKEQVVFIPTNASFTDVKSILYPYIKDWDNFERLADKRGYTSQVLPGRFVLKQRMHNFDLVRALRSNQAVRLTFNNQERLEDLAGRVSQQIEADSMSLLTAFRAADFLEMYEASPEQALALFMPNTYEFYWNTSAIAFRDRVVREYVKFWNEDRLLKADKLGLSPLQVITLASIVQKETSKVDERPKVAGVYLNRLRKGMPLQADPTVIFALKSNAQNFDWVIKRVYIKDLSVDSPYNTYLNTGLPPGPIFMPDVNAIESVLNFESHNYIYFCASPERPGYHEFAVTYDKHQVNSRKYHEWIKKLGIE
jgi:UPF0755 protein